MGRILKQIPLAGCLLLLVFTGSAQTNSVQFGQNRLQYKNFKWRYFKTSHFNTYFSQHGLDLGKFVCQTAEKELPGIEKFMDYTLSRRVNIAIYNNYGELKQSNIGIGLDWQNTAGVTKLVGNKMIVYFNGDHNNLKIQIRQGIAKVILNNILFGDDLGQFAGNAVLLNFPTWFTDGFVAFVAQNWSAKLDNNLKIDLLSGDYNNFNQLAFDHPTLAGHAFWYYVESKYGKDAVSYLLYIARIQRSLPRASQQVLHVSFKDALNDFMMVNRQRFLADNRGRRQYTKGIPVVVKELNNNKDFYQFHPRPFGRDYAMVEYRKGIYRVLLNQGFYQPTILYKSGVRQMKANINPNYPLISWDPKGNRLGVLYEQKGKLKLLIYDLLTRTKTIQTLPFEAVNSLSFMLDYNTLLLSAVRDGHSAIFTYSLGTFKVNQITHDIYDDLDPSYVAFPKKSGIIYSSNRPSPDAKSADTILPHQHFNIFLIDNWNHSRDKQISQLTDFKNADARYPSQYNDSYFTFLSRKNGINNRYAGYFKSTANGLDSLFYVGTQILHNPDRKDLDSTLAQYGSQQPDSIRVVAITSDSSYIFPLTNYSYGISETNVAGINNQITDVIRQGDLKRVTKLKVDDAVLQHRNIHTPPTYFRKFQGQMESMSLGLPSYYTRPDTSKKSKDFFLSPFSNEPLDTNLKKEEISQPKEVVVPLLQSARLLPYHLLFSSDYLIAQLDNSVLINRYQPFTGGGGPIYLQQPLNGLIQMGVSDMMEDYKFTGGFRVPSNFQGSEYFFAYQNLKHLIDWKVLYYRKVDKVGFQNTSYTGNLKTNLYQITGTLPFDQVRSIRATLGVRTDRTTVLASDPLTLQQPDLNQTYGLLRLSYIYDNTINPAINIWYGTRYKIYTEMFPQLNVNKQNGRFTFNFGVDARHYVQIYKNFIWATRFSADFSWGNKKLLYYLGGVDNWLAPKYDNNTYVNQNGDYAYQTLSENLRGYDQNIKNGNNVMLVNTELRLPVFSTFINAPINSNFLRNFQLTSFMDIGTAWNQKLSFKDANYLNYGQPPVVVSVKNGFLGPFVAGYGFGARSTIAGYFLRLDAGWPMTGFFQGKPILYLALGVDF
ncbi:MAG: hypothetical protein ACYCOO_00695 [Chitinophagaceae bacterium]